MLSALGGCAAAAKARAHPAGRAPIFQRLIKASQGGERRAGGGAAGASGEALKKNLQPSSWERRYSQIELFKAEHGHCRVGSKDGEPELARWASRQRHAWREGRLAPALCRRLQRLGFVWDLQQEAWEARFGDLQDFHERYGHCHVPRNWTDHEGLHQWTMRQRAGSDLHSDRHARLDCLGFWGPRPPRGGGVDLGGKGAEVYSREAAWRAKLGQLEEHGREHGSLRGPFPPGLAAWVSKQRLMKRQGRLPLAHEEALAHAGLEWDLKGASWESKCDLLAAYVGDVGPLQAWLVLEEVSGTRHLYVAPSEGGGEDFVAAASWGGRHGMAPTRAAESLRDIKIWLREQEAAAASGELPAHRIERLAGILGCFPMDP